MAQVEKKRALRTVEIFAGGGGLALGWTKAGAAHTALLEWNWNACETLLKNQRFWGGKHKVTCGDARSFDYSVIREKIDVVAGGPPCQPFSLGGKHGANTDDRDMFPEAIRAIRELRPKAFVIENVKGLTRKAFEDYFEYIILQMTYPAHVRKANESWIEHRARLERLHTRGGKESTHEYGVVFRLLNAADYGVPQKRERVFFVGIRRDLGVDYSFPEPTCSPDRLLYDKWITGEYWDRHKTKPKGEKPGHHTLERIGGDLFINALKPWRSVRDALASLPNPDADHRIANHEMKGAPAKQYVGHTGSSLDEPAKTIKAGVHGVPGGENMVVPDRGSPRYLTVREAARLQTFPDNYEFSGSWTEAMRQLGNAVPVQLGKLIAKSVMQALERE